MYRYVSNMYMYIEYRMCWYVSNEFFPLNSIHACESWPPSWIYQTPVISPIPARLDPFQLNFAFCRTDAIDMFRMSFNLWTRSKMAAQPPYWRLCHHITLHSITEDNVFGAVGDARGFVERQPSWLPRVATWLRGPRGCRSTWLRARLSSLGDVSTYISTGTRHRCSTVHHTLTLLLFTLEFHLHFFCPWLSNVW